MIATLLACYSAPGFSGGGPLGIDHKLPYDDSGIWKRSNQLLLEDLTLATVLGGSLWEGGESRLGNGFWRSLDASVLGAVSSTAGRSAAPGATTRSTARARSFSSCCPVPSRWD